MATFKNGILGGFSGKVGSVIGGKWKGQNTMRAVAESVTNRKTPAQMNQRKRFITVLGFLQSMTSFIRTGFKLFSAKMTEFNAAMSYLLANAIAGDYPDFTIDFPNVLVSRGDLLGAKNGAVASANPGEVAFTWDDNSGISNALATDKAMVLVYNPTKKLSVSDAEGAGRDAAGQVLNMPADFSGDEVHSYLGFVSEDGT